MRLKLPIPYPPININEWHLWFAWRPVRIENQIVWWEYVQRRNYSYNWHYKFNENQTEVVEAARKYKTIA